MRNNTAQSEREGGGEAVDTDQHKEAAYGMRTKGKIFEFPDSNCKKKNNLVLFKTK